MSTQNSKTLKVRLENTVYITVTKDFKNVFINGSKSGTDEKADCEAIQRLLSWGIKYGAPLNEAIHAMKGIKGGYQYNDLGQQLLSLPDAIAKGLEILNNK